MALSQGAINSARSGAGELSTLAGNLKTAGAALKEVLRNNGNYQYFKIGTDKGTSVDKNINLAVDTIVDKLSPEISNLVSAINAFCARQEELNREEQLRLQQARMQEEQANGNNNNVNNL